MAAFAYSMVIGTFYHIIGFILSFGMASVYIWALVNWMFALEDPTKLTTFRAWKLNFVTFWVYVGATLLNIVCAYEWIPFNPFPPGQIAVLNPSFWMIKYGPYVGVGVGGFLIAGGIFLSWTIKQLWLTYDPERLLAFEPFDYFPFMWEDEQPQEEPKDET